MLLLSLGAVAPVYATVTTANKPLRVQAYDDAAAGGGMREWGATVTNDTVTHVLFRLQGGQAALTVLLPPATSQPAAEQWLESLSSALAWPDARLELNAQPEAVALRIESSGAVTSRGFGQSHTALDLDLLERHLRDWKKPALLAVRGFGVDQLTSSVPAVASPVDDRNRYLFYRLGTTTQGSLVLDYGVNRRRVAAILSTLLLWLLFPAVGLLVVRSYLHRRRDIEPRERLRVYRRWQRGIGFTGSVGPILTFIPLGIGRSMYLLGSVGNPAILAPLLWLWPLLGWGLTGRLIGLPIEREAFPQRKDLPWYRAASTELGSALVFGSIGIITTWFVVRSRNSGGSSLLPLGVLSMAPALIAGLFLVAVIATALVMFWRAKKGKGSSHPAAPAEISGPILELSTRLGCPLERVTVRKSRGGTDSITVAVVGKAAVITDAAVKALDPEQVAALAVAAALAQPRTTREKQITNGLLAFSFLPFLVLAGFGLRALLTHRSPGSSLNVILLLNIVPMFAGQMITRRTRKRSEEADLLVAEALPEPRRFLDALKTIEDEVTADSGTGSTSVAAQLFSQRRRSLEQKLGLAA